jgi:hypothetical protein
MRFPAFPPVGTGTPTWRLRYRGFFLGTVIAMLFGLVGAPPVNPTAVHRVADQSTVRGQAIQDGFAWQMPLEIDGSTCEFLFGCEQIDKVQLTVIVNPGAVASRIYWRRTGYGSDYSNVRLAVIVECGSNADCANPPEPVDIPDGQSGYLDVWSPTPRNGGTLAHTLMFYGLFQGRQQVQDVATTGTAFCRQTPDNICIYG